MCLAKNPLAENGLILEPGIFIVMTSFVGPHFSSPLESYPLPRENVPGDPKPDADRSQTVAPSSMEKQESMDISPEMKRRLLIAIFR